MTVVLTKCVESALRAGHDRAPQTVLDLNREDRAIAHRQVMAIMVRLAQEITPRMAEVGGITMRRVRRSGLSAEEQAAQVFVSMLREAIGGP